MYFLIDACKHPTILRVLYFGYLFWEILAVVIPIGLILMLMIDFGKAVVANSDDVQIKSTKLVSKRIMYAIFIFAIPWLVNTIMGVLSSAGIELGDDYNLCINTVKNIEKGIDSFEEYDKLLEIDEQIEKDNRNGGTNTNGNTNNSSNNTSSTRSNETADRMINLATGELGKTDRSRYGAGAGEAWCAYFTTWVLKNTTMDNGKTIYAYLKSFGTINDAAASGLWPAFRNGRSGVKFNKSNAYGNNYTPKKGDVVWFQWPASRGASYCRKNFGNWDGQMQCSDHVGIVSDVKNNKVYTIEGNSGGKVSSKEYPINTDWIIAYGSWY